MSSWVLLTLSSATLQDYWFLQVIKSHRLKSEHTALRGVLSTRVKEMSICLAVTSELSGICSWESPLSSGSAELANQLHQGDCFKCWGKINRCWYLQNVWIQKNIDVSLPILSLAILFQNFMCKALVVILVVALTLTWTSTYHTE